MKGEVRPPLTKYSTVKAALALSISTEQLYCYIIVLLPIHPPQVGKWGTTQKCLGPEEMAGVTEQAREAINFGSV